MSWMSNTSTCEVGMNSYSMVSLFRGRLLLPWRAARLAMAMSSCSQMATLDGSWNFGNAVLTVVEVLVFLNTRRSVACSSISCLVLWSTMWLASSRHWIGIKTANTWLCVCLCIDKNTIVACCMLVHPTWQSNRLSMLRSSLVLSDRRVIWLSITAIVDFCSGYRVVYTVGGVVYTVGGVCIAHLPPNPIDSYLQYAYSSQPLSACMTVRCRLKVSYPNISSIQCTSAFSLCLGQCALREDNNENSENCLESVFVLLKIMITISSIELLYMFHPDVFSILTTRIVQCAF